MCQLIYSNLGKKELNSLYMTLALSQNSALSNKDGWGIFTAGKEEPAVIKSDKAAIAESKLGEILFNECSMRPIMGHVRFATVCPQTKKKEICVENSHPFDKEKIVLAHNGSLSRVDKTVPTGTMIDSEFFAETLNEFRKKYPFVKALQKSYELFEGKFAFLIYDKDSKKYYAARGLQATLYMAEFSQNNKNIGYVINTTREDLEKTVHFYCRYSASIGYLDITHKISLLPHNTIFELRNIPTIVGSIEERTVEPEKSFLPQNPAPISGTRNTAGNVDGIDATIELIINDWKLSFWEIDELCSLILGNGILYLSDVEIDILEESCDLLDTYFSKNKQKIWSSICDYKKVYNAYSEFSLQFPYFLNSAGRLRVVLAEIKKDLKKHDKNSNTSLLAN